MKEGDDPVVPHEQHVPEAVQAPVPTRERPAVLAGPTGPQPCPVGRQREKAHLGQPVIGVYLPVYRYSGDQLYEYQVDATIEHHIILGKFGIATRIEIFYRLGIAEKNLKAGKITGK